MSLGELYNYLFVELSMTETREWLFISWPYPLMLITFGYLYFVLYAGPRYMKIRPPYELRIFVLIYDLIQILSNLWFVKEYLSSDLFSEFTVICRLRNAFHLNATKLNNILWWWMILKLFDYIETCVFVLRKKQNQVSGLHVYHHISNLTFVWYYLKYILDERISFFVLFNCSIHIVMYIYYFITAWSPDLKQMMSPIKPFLTKLQMIQLIIMLIAAMQILNPSCEVHRMLALPFAVNIGIILYLFYDFYKKSYISKQKKN